MPHLELTKGCWVTIDDQDIPIIIRGSWYANVAANGMVYARRSWREGGVRKSEFLHRAIIGAKKGDLVDHLDGNPMNCRRSNLRIVNHNQNGTNKRTYSKHGFKGIKFMEGRTKPWATVVSVNGKTKTIGYFLTKEEAAEAYDAAVRKLLGSGVSLNFPKEGELSARR